jgi:hypothetical protein
MKKSKENIYIIKGRLILYNIKNLEGAKNDEIW